MEEYVYSIYLFDNNTNNTILYVDNPQINTHNKPTSQNGQKMTKSVLLNDKSSCKGNFTHNRVILKTCKLSVKPYEMIYQP